MEAYLGLMWGFRLVNGECSLTPAMYRSDTLGSPSTSTIFMQTVAPIWYLQLMSRFSQKRHLVHARHTANLANAITKQLVDSKADALLQGKGNKDILSLLGRSSFVQSFSA